jgi:hypothetical protein
MAPSTISAAAGGIEKVKGTSTATAIVAVRPGKAPITVPATTPARASSRFSRRQRREQEVQAAHGAARRGSRAYFLTMPISLASAP